MRTCLKRFGDDPCFVIYDLEEAYQDAARQLGYGDVDGGFGSIAPADNPYVERAFHNFQRYIEPMLLQAAGVEPVPSSESLLVLLRTLDGKDTDWWLLGSAALAVRGLPVSPRDGDIVHLQREPSMVAALSSTVRPSLGKGEGSWPSIVHQHRYQPFWRGLVRHRYGANGSIYRWQGAGSPVG